MVETIRSHYVQVRIHLEFMILHTAACTSPKILEHEVIHV